MIPKHVAIIMDGNGRWAQERGLSRSEGHRAGAARVRDVVRNCADLGIRYLTLYAFSTENWSRPPQEVAALMELLGRFLEEQREMIRNEGIQLRAIGDLQRIPWPVRRKLQALIRSSAANQRGVLTLALSYGSRWEITEAVRTLAGRVAAGALRPAEIDEQQVAAALQNSDIPDPDLIVRTAGEQRLSNFLLWQASYAEFYFSPVLWPDFDRPSLEAAVEEYARRQRRYGRV